MKRYLALIIIVLSLTAATHLMAKFSSMDVSESGVVVLIGVVGVLMVDNLGIGKYK